MNPMMAQQYGQMNPMAQQQQQQQQQQQRYANGGMPYAVPGSGPMAPPVRMSNAMPIPTSYADNRGGMAPTMGFQVGPQGYGMVPPNQMQRMNPATQGMPQPSMTQQSMQPQSMSHQSMAMPQQSMTMQQQSMAMPQQSMTMSQQSMPMGQQGMPQQSMQVPQPGMVPMQMNGPPNSGPMADASGN